MARQVGNRSMRLQTLREDHAAWRLPRDTGQFSLAGAQPNMAFLLQKDRWEIPSGRIPTTHILKPPTGHFDGYAENEHICLLLARQPRLACRRYPGDPVRKTNRHRDRTL